MASSRVGWRASQFWCGGATELIVTLPRLQRKLRRSVLGTSLKAHLWEKEDLMGPWRGQPAGTMGWRTADTGRW
jgi:hypothetical protein